MVRVKHRYLLLEILLADEFGGFAGTLPPNFNEGSLANMIRDNMALNFGDVGAARLGHGLSVKYLSLATRLALIRVSHDVARTVWAVLTLTRQIKGIDCCIRVTHCAGTVRKAQQAAIRRDRAAIIMNGA